MHDDVGLDELSPEELDRLQSLGPDEIKALEDQGEDLVQQEAADAAKELRSGARELAEGEEFDWSTVPRPPLPVNPWRYVSQKRRRAVVPPRAIGRPKARARGPRRRRFAATGPTRSRDRPREPEPDLAEAAGRLPLWRDLGASSRMLVDAYVRPSPVWDQIASYVARAA